MSSSCQRICSLTSSFLFNYAEIKSIFIFKTNCCGGFASNSCVLPLFCFLERLICLAFIEIGLFTFSSIYLCVVMNCLTVCFQIIVNCTCIVVFPCACLSTFRDIDLEGLILYFHHIVNMIYFSIHAHLDTSCHSI